MLDQLPFELLELIASHLRIDDYQELRQALPQLPEIPQLSYEAYKSSWQYLYEQDLKIDFHLSLEDFDDEQFLYLALNSHSIEFVRALALKGHVISIEAKQAAFQASILSITFDENMIIALLKYHQDLHRSSIDPSVDNNMALFYAAMHGYTDLVRMLLQDPRVDPSGAEVMETACLEGQAEVVELLLEDPRVDLTIHGLSAMEASTLNGHAHVVQLLLKDGRVDPAMEENLPLHQAAENGHADVVRILLNDDRVDPTSGENFALQAACRKGHQQVVELLLSDARIDPSWPRQQPIKLAAEKGHSELVRLLLKDDRVDPTFDAFAPLLAAAVEGHETTVFVLLQDSRMQGCDQLVLFESACMNGWMDLLAQLADQIQPNSVSTLVMKHIVEEAHVDAVFYLLQHPSWQSAVSRWV